MNISSTSRSARDLEKSYRTRRDNFGRCWLEVGLSWLMLELCCDIYGSKIATKTSKMGQDASQETAICSQDGDLGSILEFWGSFWIHFGRFLADKLHIKKCRKAWCFYMSFEWFFSHNWKWAQLEMSDWGLCWVKLGLIGSFSFHVYRAFISTLTSFLGTTCQENMLM